MKRVPLRLVGMALMAAVGPNLPGGFPPPSEIPCLRAEADFPKYRQELRIQFANPEAAGQARVRLAPLFNGHERAVACRWDDNVFENEEVKRRIDAHGVKATWYLNSNGVAYLKGRDYRGVARRLLENGHSIGSHALTHPYLTRLNRNRMFHEVASVRIEWEAELDTPVLSHSFSFIDYRNEHEGDLSQADALRSLERAGLYHVAEFKTTYDDLPSSLIYSIIMPPENQTFDSFAQAVKWAVGDAECRTKFPLISHSMHGWYGTPALHYGWDELEKRLAHLGKYTNFWQTNQNAYAAYRYQYEHSDMRQANSGGEVRLDIERPRARYLNDEIPLTLRIENTDLRAVLKATLDGEALPLNVQSADALLINLPHSPTERVPKRIGKIENPHNERNLTGSHADPKLPGITALLSYDGEPRIILRNDSGAAMRDMTVTWRMPLQWQPGWITEQLDDLEHGAEISRHLSGVNRSDDAALRNGSAYLAAQLDFMRRDIPVRLHLTCELPPEGDSSFPRDGFALLGPIPPLQMTVAEVSQSIASQGQPIRQLSTRGGFHAVLETGRPGAAFNPQWLSPEIVPTLADWYQIHSQIYLLQSVVSSAVDQDFQMLCQSEDVHALWVNGSQVTALCGRFRSGENDVAIIYHHTGVQTPARHSGGFLRFVDPGTGERLTNIEFRPAGA